MDQKAWVDLLSKHFKQPSIDFVKEAVLLNLIPAADAYVAASPNKIDDAVWAFCKEAILKSLDSVK